MLYPSETLEEGKSNSDLSSFTMFPSYCNRALESMFIAILNQSHKFTVTTITKPFSPKQVGLLE